MELEEKFEETNNDDESVVPDEKSVDELSCLLYTSDAADEP